jgi:hypothetical protein
MCRRAGSLSSKQGIHVGLDAIHITQMRSLKTGLSEQASFTCPECGQQCDVLQLHTVSFARNVLDRYNTEHFVMLCPRNAQRGCVGSSQLREKYASLKKKEQVLHKGGIYEQYRRYDGDDPNHISVSACNALMVWRSRAHHRASSRTGDPFRHL